MSDTLRVESASLSDALARILTLLPSDRPQAESVALDESLGRTLAQDLLSPIDVPAYTNSAMDGYAFRGEELAGEGLLELTVALRANRSPATPANTRFRRARPFTS